MAELTYRGRAITAADVLYMQELIAAHPRASRRRLSQTLLPSLAVEAVQRFALRDMVCRGLLLTLDRAGQIELPTVRYVPRTTRWRGGCGT